MGNLLEIDLKHLKIFDYIVKIHHIERKNGGKVIFSNVWQYRVKLSNKNFDEFLRQNGAFIFSPKGDSQKRQC